MRNQTRRHAGRPERSLLAAELASRIHPAQPLRSVPGIDSYYIDAAGGAYWLRVASANRYTFPFAPSAGRCMTVSEVRPSMLVLGRVDRRRNSMAVFASVLGDTLPLTGRDSRSPRFSVQPSGTGLSVSGNPSLQFRFLFVIPDLEERLIIERFSARFDQLLKTTVEDLRDCEQTARERPADPEAPCAEVIELSEHRARRAGLSAPTAWY